MPPASIHRPTFNPPFHVELTMEEHAHIFDLKTQLQTNESRCILIQGCLHSLPINKKNIHDHSKMSLLLYFVVDSIVLIPVTIYPMTILNVNNITNVEITFLAKNFVMILDHLSISAISYVANCADVTNTNFSIIHINILIPGVIFIDAVIIFMSDTTTTTILTITPSMTVTMAFFICAASVISMTIAAIAGRLSH